MNEWTPKFEVQIIKLPNILQIRSDETPPLNIYKKAIPESISFDGRPSLQYPVKIEFRNGLLVAQKVEKHQKISSFQSRNSADIANFKKCSRYKQLLGSFFHQTTIQLLHQNSFF